MTDRPIQKTEFQYFKDQFNEFKKVVEKGFSELNLKFDRIVDPQNGLFKKTNESHQAIIRAHERIDETNDKIGAHEKNIKELYMYWNGNPMNGQRGGNARIDDLEDFVNTFRKVIWKILAPILGLLGIGAIVTAAILLPKISKAIETINRMNP